MYFPNFQKTYKLNLNFCDQSQKFVKSNSNQSVNGPPLSYRKAYYKIEQPDGAPDWQTVFTFQMLFPK
jgi:hypothetical protein